MCGITGIINYKKDISKNRHTLHSMSDTLAKRGPNANGYYISTNVLLGHRRLIVVDPEGGKQPMIKKLENRGD